MLTKIITGHGVATVVPADAGQFESATIYLVRESGETVVFESPKKVMKYGQLAYVQGAKIDGGVIPSEIMSSLRAAMVKHEAAVVKADKIHRQQYAGNKF